MIFFLNQDHKGGAQKKQKRTYTEHPRTGCFYNPVQQHVDVITSRRTYG